MGVAFPIYIISMSSQKWLRRGDGLPCSIKILTSLFGGGVGFGLGVPRAEAAAPAGVFVPDDDCTASPIVKIFLVTRVQKRGIVLRACSFTVWEREKSMNAVERVSRRRGKGEISIRRGCWGVQMPKAD